MFLPQKPTPCAIDYLRLHLLRLGAPGAEAWAFMQQLEGLPCDLDGFKKAWALQPNPSQVDVPHRGLADFVHRCLRWLPADRIGAVSASEDPFLCRHNLGVTVSVQPGKHGPGSICSGVLEDELLDYLQQCPSWEKFCEHCLVTNFQPNRCIRE